MSSATSLADVFGPLSSLGLSSRLVGLEPSLDSRGLVGVPGGAAAATAAALEDGRCGGGASPSSLVLDTMVDRSVMGSLYQSRLFSIRVGIRFDVNSSK